MCYYVMFYIIYDDFMMFMIIYDDACYIFYYDVMMIMILNAMDMMKCNIFLFLYVYMYSMHGANV